MQNLTYAKHLTDLARAVCYPAGARKYRHERYAHFVELSSTNLRNRAAADIDRARELEEIAKTVVGGDPGEPLSETVEISIGRDGELQKYMMPGGITVCEAVRRSDFRDLQTGAGFSFDGYKVMLGDQFDVPSDISIGDARTIVLFDRNDAWHRGVLKSDLSERAR
jgi:hypothetical protein